MLMDCLNMWILCLYFRKIFAYVIVYFSLILFNYVYIIISLNIIVFNNILYIYIYLLIYLEKQLYLYSYMQFYFFLLLSFLLFCY